MRLPRLFLLAIVLLQLHLVEQLLFGLDELYELRDMVGMALTWFADPDRGTVVLVFAAVTVVLLACYGFMAGGTPRLVAAGFFGVEFLFEGHHIVKTIVGAAYFPGAVTAIGFVVLGLAILATVRREARLAVDLTVDGSRLQPSEP